MPPGLIYHSIDELLLDKAKFFTPPQESLDKLGEPKLCFMNAYQYMLSHDDIIYVEGYANRVIPLMHAWCVDKTGVVLETTWEEPGEAYFGVAINREYVFDIVLKARRYGVLDAWDLKWPILADPPEKWLHN